MNDIYYSRKGALSWVITKIIAAIILLFDNNNDNEHYYYYFKDYYNNNDNGADTEWTARQRSRKRQESKLLDC